MGNGSVCPMPGFGRTGTLACPRSLWRYRTGQTRVSVLPANRATANYSYKWQSNSNYLTANILDSPCLLTVYGPGPMPPPPTSCAPPSVQANQDAQTAYGYDENNGSPQGVYGNQTSVTRWLNGGTSPKTQYVYNSNGMRTKMCDPIDLGCA